MCVPLGARGPNFRKNQHAPYSPSPIKDTHPVARTENAGVARKRVKANF